MHFLAGGLNFDFFFFKLVCLACRLANDCAKITAKAGYKYFGIQFYGGCLSGKKPRLEYDPGGPSKNCVSENATRWITTLA